MTQSTQLEEKVIDELRHAITELRDAADFKGYLNELVCRADELSATIEIERLQKLQSDLQLDVQTMQLTGLLAYKKQTIDFVKDNFAEIEGDLDRTELQQKKQHILQYKKALKNTLDTSVEQLDSLTNAVKYLALEFIDLNSLLPTIEVLQQALQTNEQMMSLGELRICSVQTRQNWESQASILVEKLNTYQAEIDKEIQLRQKNLKAEYANVSATLNATEQSLLSIKQDSSSYAHDFTVQKIDQLLENIQHAKKTLLTEDGILSLSVEQLAKSSVELIDVLNEKIHSVTNKIETVETELESQTPKMAFATPEKNVSLPTMSAASPEADDTLMMGLASPLVFTQAVMAPASPVAIAEFSSAINSGLATASPDASTTFFATNMGSASPEFYHASNKMAAASPDVSQLSSATTMKMAPASPELSQLSSSTTIGMAAASPVLPSAANAMAAASPIASSSTGMAPASPLASSTIIGMATASPVLPSAANVMAAASPIASSIDTGLAAASPIASSAETGMATASPVMPSAANVMGTASPIAFSTDTGLAAASPIASSAETGMATASPVMPSAANVMATASPVAFSTDNGLAVASPIASSAETGMATASPVMPSAANVMATASPIASSIDTGLAAVSPIASSAETGMATASPVMPSAANVMAAASPIASSVETGMAIASLVTAGMGEVSPVAIDMAVASPVLPTASYETVNIEEVLVENLENKNSVSSPFWKIMDTPTNRKRMPVPATPSYDFPQP